MKNFWALVLICATFIICTGHGHYILATIGYIISQVALLISIIFLSAIIYLIIEDYQKTKAIKKKVADSLNNLN